MSRRRNRTSSIIGGVVGIAIAVSGIAHAVSPDQKTIRSDGFTAKAPKGWVDGTRTNRSDLSSDEDRVYGEPGKVRPPRVIVNVIPDTGPDATSSLDALTSDLGSTGSTGGGMLVGAVRPASLDGAPARRLTVRQTVAGKPYVDHVLLAARGAKVYVVHLVRPAAQDAKARNDLREVAGSWDWS